MDGRERSTHRLPYGAQLMVADGHIVSKGDRIAQWDPAYMPVITDKKGMIRYQDLTVNPAAQTVERSNARVPLTSREWAILMQLLTNQGIPQSRSRLEESLYGWQEEIESNAIEVHVSNLRKKLGAKLIKTVRNIGYVVEKA